MDFHVGTCCSGIDIENDMIHFVFLWLFMDEMWRATIFVKGQASLREVRVGKFHDTQIITMASKSEKNSLYGGCINIPEGWLEGCGRRVVGHCGG